MSELNIVVPMAGAGSRFAKAGYKDYFSETDTLYVTFISQFGGTIKARALFPNNHGGFGPVDVLEVAKRNEEK